MLSLILLLLLPPVELTRQVYLMGTRCDLIVHSQNPQTGEQQLDAYIRILDDADAELSVWRNETALSLLNRHPVGQPIRVSPSLFELLEKVVFWWKATDRTFDPGIGKLLRVWGHYDERRRVPSRDEIETAHLQSGMQYFELKQETLEVIRNEDALLDSGAFGKGEGLDRVFEFASLEGGSPWLIDLGGQVMVYGLPPGKKAWTVAIAHPQHRDREAMSLELPSGSLATSGDSEQPGHILDPETGIPAEFKGSVTVWHDSALIADIVDTALFVMGPTKGLAWAESRGLAACFLLAANTGELEVRATTAFRKKFNLQ